MFNLIEELKQEHAVMFENLNKVRSLGIGSKEAQNMLFNVKRGFIAHLKKEDDQLYPALKKAAESDIDLKQTLDIFAKDMGEISKNVLGFFKKYSGGGSGLEFARDFGKLYATLFQRMSKERNIIYAKYDELKQ